MIHLEQSSFNLRYCAPYLLSGLLCTGCLKLPEFRDDTGGATDAARPLDRSLDAQVSDADQPSSDRSVTADLSEISDMSRLDLDVDASSSPEDMSPTDPQDLALDEGVDLGVTDMGELDAQVPAQDWLRVTSDGMNSLVVSNEHLRIEWNRIIAAPTSLKLNDAEFLWGSDINGSNEIYAGILLFQTLASHNASDPVIEVLHPGPGVVRISVAWEARGTNSEAQTSATGTTIWTLHDDGRLFRDENFTLDYSRTDNEILVGYHAVPIERVSRINRTNTDGEMDSVRIGSELEDDFDIEESRQAQSLCASGEQGSILFAAYQPSPSQDGLRYTRSGANGVARSLQLQFDWAWRRPLNTPEWSGVLLTSLNEDCEVATTFEHAHRDPPELRVTLGGDVLYWPGDEDRDGYYERGGFYTVASDNESLVTLAFSAPTAPSITLWVEHSSETAPGVSVDGRLLAPEAFIASRGRPDSDPGWFVHIRRSIEPTETLTIGF